MSQEKFAQVEALRKSAESALAEGDLEMAGKLTQEMESTLEQAEKESDLQERIAKSLKAEMKPMNTVPVVEEEVKTDALNEKRSDGSYRNHVDANYRPAGYQKDLPPMAQTTWVQDKMGSNLKAEAAFQRDTWMKWFTAKSQEEFFRTASAEETKAMQEDTDSEGGYFVPEEFINSTFVIPEASGGQLRDACTVLRVNSKDGYVPTLDSVSMSYLAEEAAYTGAEQTPTVGQVTFGVLKIAGLTRVSDELLADSVPNLPALLTQIFQSANGRFQDKEILAGNGSSRYNGIVNGVDAAGASVTYTTMANATSVVAADIVEAYFDVPQQHRGVETFRWVFPSAISGLINGIGTTAAGIHAIQSLTNAPDAFLMGRQVLNVDVSGQPFGTTITSTEKIGLAGNMSAYYLFERAGMSIRRNDSLYMGNGQVGFFATARSDGRMATAEAFKLLRAA